MSVVFDVILRSCCQLKHDVLCGSLNNTPFLSLSTVLGCWPKYFYNDTNKVIEHLLRVKKKKKKGTFLQHMDKSVIHNAIFVPEDVQMTQWFSYQSQFMLLYRIKILLFLSEWKSYTSEKVDERQKIVKCLLDLYKFVVFFFSSTSEGIFDLIGLQGPLPRHNLLTIELSVTAMS